MKKQYICPNCFAVRINAKGILMTSGFQNLGADSATGGLSETEITGTSNVWTKESSSIWDDEW